MAKIIYTKYANERDRKFSVRTDIIEHSDGSRYLKKEACYPEGQDHIEHIYQTGIRIKELLKDSGILVNRCWKKGKSIELEYVKGKTLQEELDELLLANKKEQFRKKLEDYLNKLCNLANDPFSITEEFQEIFGTVSFERKQLCTACTDIDMILSNILVSADGTQTLIDYEWTFGFPVPIKFVIFRVIHYYEQSSELRNQIRVENWYQKMDITVGEKEQFEKMERAFQKFVLGKYTPMRQLLGEISPGYINIPHLLKRNSSLNVERLQVFHSCDGIIREKDSEFFGISEGHTERKIELRLEDHMLRLDPGENGGVIRIEKIFWDTGEKCIFETNGTYIGNGTYLFDAPDPQILIKEIPEKARVLQVTLEKITLDTSVLQSIKNGLEEKYREKLFKLETVQKNLEKENVHMQESKSKLQEECEELKQIISMQRQEIETMKSTKIWRMYQKYKSLGRGE